MINKCKTGKYSNTRTDIKYVSSNAFCLLKEIGRNDVNWIHVAQDGDQWRIIINTVMDFLLP
jgi:hypothetical protein